MKKILYVLVHIIVFAAVVAMVIFVRTPGYAWLKIMLFAIPFCIIVTALFIDYKKTEKKEKEYRDKHISEIIINDKVFGKIKFERDAHLNQLCCKNFNMPFGKYNPTIEIEDYDANNNELYFRSLEYLYSMQQEVSHTLFDVFWESYSTSKEVTKDKLDSTFDIKRIEICKCDENFSSYLLEEGELIKGDCPEFCPEDWIIIVSCEPDKNNVFHNYYALKPIAYMDCKTKNICYMLDE